MEQTYAHPFAPRNVFTPPYTPKDRFAAAEIKRSASAAVGKPLDGFRLPPNSYVIKTNPQPHHDAVSELSKGVQDLMCRKDSLSDGKLIGKFYLKKIVVDARHGSLYSPQEKKTLTDRAIYAVLKIPGRDKAIMSNEEYSILFNPKNYEFSFQENVFTVTPDFKYIIEFMEVRRPRPVTTKAKAAINHLKRRFSFRTGAALIRSPSVASAAYRESRQPVELCDRDPSETVLCIASSVIDTSIVPKEPFHSVPLGIMTPNDDLAADSPIKKVAKFHGHVIAEGKNVFARAIVNVQEESTDRIGSWEYVFCVVKRDAVEFYVSERDLSPKRSIPLKTVVRESVLDAYRSGACLRQHTLQFKSDTSRFYLQVDGPQMVIEWMTALKDAIDVMQAWNGVA